MANCVCRHSEGAHKPKKPRTCSLCSCIEYRDVALQPAAQEPLTADAEKALTILSKNPAFDGLTSEHLHEMARRGRRRLFMDGTDIIIEGDPSESVYILAKGRVDIVRSAKSMSPMHLATLGPGELVGEMGIVTGGRQSATVTAMEDLETLEIDIEDLKDIFRQDPHVLMAFAKVMHDRLAPRKH